MSSHQSNQISFGTDGFRGIVARDFTFDIVKKIAQGMADYIAYKYMRSPEKPQVVVGYDRRFMGERFARIFADILAANKLTVVLSEGPLPSPGIFVI